MRNTSPLRPVHVPSRSAGQVRNWKTRRAKWMADLQPERHFQALFDHIPDVHFFAKDHEGRLMFASRSLLQRYQMRDDSEFIGRTDHDINPQSMAECYVRDDRGCSTARPGVWSASSCGGRLRAFPNGIW